ncbi:MAG TPA: response regulator transcription factor [Geopsychrobacteraceae bacterium]|nr:response regulator transcription factor [Geopsychrobacteraceae bacterium]
MSIKIVITDDHTILREGISLLLKSQVDIEIVGEASDGIEAVEKVRATHPDVLLLDIAMSRMNGLDTIELVRQVAPETQIIILSRYEKEAYVHQALKAGALGYVVKGAPSSELLEAIRAVAQGRFYLSSEVHDSVISTYLESTRESPLKNDAFNQLSDREKQVFNLLVQGNSSNQIGEILCISSKTVDKHRANLSKKIGIDNPVKMVQYAIRNGIIDPSFWED